MIPARSERVKLRVERDKRGSGGDRVSSFDPLSLLRVRFPSSPYLSLLRFERVFPLPALPLFFRPAAESRERTRGRAHTLPLFLPHSFAPIRPHRLTTGDDRGSRSLPTLFLFLSLA